MICIVEREKAVAITALFAHKKVGELSNPIAGSSSRKKAVTLLTCGSPATSSGIPGLRDS